MSRALAVLLISCIYITNVGALSFHSPAPPSSRLGRQPLPSRRSFLSSSFLLPLLVPLPAALLVPLPAAFAAAPPPLPSSSASLSTLSTALSALTSLLSNWSSATTDCTTADVSRDLLEAKNKDQLLEKAATFALFDKDSAVMSCRESSTKVRKFISTLKNLDKEFKGLRDSVDDLDAYFALVDSYTSSVAAANSYSYMSSQDFSSMNGKKVTEDGGQQLNGGTDNMEAARAELERARAALQGVVEMAGATSEV
jgi:hypothetical protein